MRVPACALGAILLLSLAAKLFLWSAYVAADPIRGSDSDVKEYQRNALALVETGRFVVSSNRPDMPETRRTPGYPAFLAAIYRIWGVSPAAAVLAQIVVSIGTIGLTFCSALRRWNARVATAAALLLALDPLSTAFSEMLLSETLFAFAITALAALAIELAESPAPRRWAPAAGLALGVAALIRPIAYYLAAPLCLAIAVSLLTNRRRASEWLVVPLLVALPYAAIVGSWQLRNYLQAGSPEFSRVIGREVLLLGPAAIEAEQRQVTLREAYRALREQLNAGSPRLSEIERASRWRRFSVEKIVTHPLLFLRLGLARALGAVLGPGEHRLLRIVGDPTDASPGLDLQNLPFAEFQRQWLGHMSGPLALFLFASAYLAAIDLGVVAWCARGLARDGFTRADLLVWTILVYLLFAGYASSRFRVPAMPLLALYAARGLVMR